MAAGSSPGLAQSTCSSTACGTGQRTHPNTHIHTYHVLSYIDILRTQEDRIKAFIFQPLPGLGSVGLRAGCGEIVLPAKTTIEGHKSDQKMKTASILRSQGTKAEGRKTKKTLEQTLAKTNRSQGATEKAKKAEKTSEAHMSRRLKTHHMV